ncbi:MAG: hypothetical protein CVT93_06965 [Bacteroidetes bacterium HGW-Bacteroidetes-10]|nr:MAG: hypothetical protein CVT93_06965 [Bacteroidetes bacterium HGW-Bacteroidetes-10]
MKAFTFVIMLIISTQFLFAQIKGDQNVPVPIKDSLIYYEAMMKANPNLTRDQLYQQVRHWAYTKLIVLPVTSPVLYENPGEGIISARLVFNPIKLGPAINSNYLIPHGIIYFQIKEGKIKFVISDITYTHGLLIGNVFKETIGNSKNLYFNATNEKNYRAFRNEYIFYLTEINNTIQNHLGSLYSFINKPLLDEF